MGKIFTNDKHDKALIETAIKKAKIWQTTANKKMSTFEKKFHKKMAIMLRNENDKVILIDLMDQCFRSNNSKRVFNQIEYIFNKYKMAKFFTSSEKFLIYLFRNLGLYFPDTSIALFINNIKNDSKSLVLKEEEKYLNKHLIKRKKEGVNVTVNLIGEVVMGEEEAHYRVSKYIKALQNPNIENLTIKLSTIYSQINPLSYDKTIEVLIERLTKIYEEAVKYNKYVHIDMEEYRDLSMTYDVFTKTLENEKFKNFYAGIVLQAYLPDSHIYQKKLTTWAKERVANGGSNIRIRLVKGANMQMEVVESALKDWEIATYTKKMDTDSNYKVMLEYALDEANAPFVNIGAGSHNIFELAYAVEYAKHNKTTEYLNLEMLEGMSEALRLAIQDDNHNLSLYAPCTRSEQFTNAIAYLVRRLDENTAKDNFIRYSFELEVNSNEWEILENQFRNSFENKLNLFIGTKRDQNRLDEVFDENSTSFKTNKFINESDTDFVLENNRKWSLEITKKWKNTKDTKIEIAPIVVDGMDIVEDRKVKDAIDKSQLKEGILCGKFALANGEDLTRAVEVAKADDDNWRSKTNEQRYEILSKAANNVRQRRDDLIGVAAAEVGKTFSETDVEVSEAIDFIEFYSHSIRYFEEYENLEFKAKGVGVVVPPWNFPIAIPLGGVASTLASGNTCILKPASVAALCSYEFCKCFWDAGVSKKALQFVPCPGSLAGEHLIKNKDVDFVILTGGEDTAYSMLEGRNDLFLSAETGGKNATIITAMADKELAIKNVVRSAFLNSGQKCSATSLLILEKEVYEDEEFKKALVDAAKSLEIGSVWDFKNSVGTLANTLDGSLKESLEMLEDDESWALAPSFADDNEYMLKPSIKWGVQDNSFCHKTELFGPVLSVMKAEDLNHAINLVNATDYGLTSGIESLDEREVKIWRESIIAGNLYINRGTTGAIVLRQAFGGMKKSAIGAGRKVGIYNYVTQFMDFTETSKPKILRNQNTPLVNLCEKLKNENNGNDDYLKLYFAVNSYLENIQSEFGIEQDFCNIKGEDNIFRYLPLDNVIIRVSNDDSIFEAIARICAANIAGVGFVVSIDENKEVLDLINEHKEIFLGQKGTLQVQKEEAFLNIIKDFERVIYSNINKVNAATFKAASSSAAFITRIPTMMEGRIELLNYFKEQSISHTYHRYGNLGTRETA